MGWEAITSVGHWWLGVASGHWLPAFGGWLNTWAVPVSALFSALVAGGTIYLAIETRRLANVTGAALQNEREETELLRRDRDLQLRPLLRVTTRYLGEGITRGPRR